VKTLEIEAEGPAYGTIGRQRKRWTDRQAGGGGGNETTTPHRLETLTQRRDGNRGSRAPTPNSQNSGGIRTGISKKTVWVGPGKKGSGSKVVSLKKSKTKKKGPPPPPHLQKRLISETCPPRGGPKNHSEGKQKAREEDSHNKTMGEGKGRKVNGPQASQPIGKDGLGASGGKKSGKTSRRGAYEMGGVDICQGIRKGWVGGDRPFRQETPPNQNRGRNPGRKQPKRTKTKPSKEVKIFHASMARKTRPLGTMKQRGQCRNYRQEGGSKRANKLQKTKKGGECIARPT